MAACWPTPATGTPYESTPGSDSRLGTLIKLGLIRAPVMRPGSEVHPGHLWDGLMPNIGWVEGANLGYGSVLGILYFNRGILYRGTSFSRSSHGISRNAPLHRSFVNLDQNLFKSGVPRVLEVLSHLTVK